MFIRPEVIKYITTPHNNAHYYMKWTAPQTDGAFYHFDNFRYSPNYPREATYEMQNHTVYLMSQVLRVHQRFPVPSF
jgi:hypothetical protein